MHETLRSAMELRSLLLKSVEMKLSNDEYANSHELRKKIVKFSRLDNMFRQIFIWNFFLQVNN